MERSERIDSLISLRERVKALEVSTKALEQRIGAGSYLATNLRDAAHSLRRAGDQIDRCLG